MIPKIFISYRRDDTEGFAGRLYDKLVFSVGKDSVFMDIDSMPFGVNFVEVIHAAVSRCNVCLVLIGRAWLSSSDQEGKRRIDNPADFVRLEIENALDSDALVIPVLLQGVPMPNPNHLPESIRKLSYLNALKVGERFHPEVDRLLAQLEQATAVRKRGEAQEAQDRDAEQEVVPKAEVLPGAKAAPEGEAKPEAEAEPVPEAKAMPEAGAVPAAVNERGTVNDCRPENEEIGDRVVFEHAALCDTAFGLKTGFVARVTAGGLSFDGWLTGKYSFALSKAELAKAKATTIRDDTLSITTERGATYSIILTEGVASDLLRALRRLLDS